LLIYDILGYFLTEKYWIRRWRMKDLKEWYKNKEWSKKSNAWCRKPELNKRGPRIQRNVPMHITWTQRRLGLKTWNSTKI